MSELPNNCKRLREQLKKSLEREEAIEKELAEERTLVLCLQHEVGVARDEGKVLEAQVAVLLDTLEDARIVLRDKEWRNTHENKIYGMVSKVLATTPDEAAERVEGLVEALEGLARLGAPSGGYGNSIGNEIAKAALAQWRDHD